jgi:hypothetical protein
MGEMQCYEHVQDVLVFCRAFVSRKLLLVLGPDLEKHHESQVFCFDASWSARESALIREAAVLVYKFL